jgi:hypothetical protein
MWIMIWSGDSRSSFLLVKIMTMEVFRNSNYKINNKT